MNTFGIIGNLRLLVWVGEVCHKAWQRLHGFNLLKQDVYYDCTEFGDKPSYKSKVRVIFTNSTHHTLIVRAAKWDAGRDGVPIQRKPVSFSEPDENLPASSLEPEPLTGWEGEWPIGKEFQQLQVPPNKTFRVWVGVQLDEPSVKKREAQMRRRHERKRLGRMILPIRKNINAKEFEYKVRL
jgi:hypothetical protein